MSTAGNTNCVDRARERKGGGRGIIVSERLNPCRSGRVSALISVSSHLADRLKTVTVAKLAEGA